MMITKRSRAEQGRHVRGNRVGFVSEIVQANVEVIVTLLQNNSSCLVS